jgi:sigma-B regulation protein RsbU (phosphoserine phosphatase)
MANSQRIPVLLCSDSEPGTAALRRPLADEGYDVAVQPMNGYEPGALERTRLVLVEGRDDAERARSFCRKIRSTLGDMFVPILMLVGESSPRERLACLESGADAYLLQPFDPAELLAQVRALVRLKERHDALTDKSAEISRVNKRLQAAYHQIDLELDLARRIQEGLLPQKLPALPSIRFAVHYQPCSKVGGDFYDVFRLDEQHVGFYVADAMGHGVPASLLTIFVKKGVRAKEIFGNEYRLVPPGEVLHRLNNDLIEQALSETPFITMAYVLLNVRDRKLCFARSGHPYPLYVPRKGPPEFWQIEGSLLGVFETKYPVREHRLQPGDKLLLYTDGMDSASFASCAVGTASLLAAAEHFRELPIEGLVERLAHDLFQQTQLSDDLTLLGLEVTGEPEHGT